MIADSGTAGLHLVTANSVGNVVQGNWIGTNSSGAAGLGNHRTGITIQQGASGNLIGGTAAGAGNVISGNGTEGFRVDDNATINNSIRSNSILERRVGNRPRQQRRHGKRPERTRRANNYQSFRC